MDYYKKSCSDTKVVLLQDPRLGLVQLAFEGDTRAISVLLDEQADVNLRDQVLAYLSAILTFTLSDCLDFLLAFLLFYPRSLLLFLYQSGVSALFAAASNGHTAAVSLLLANRADLSARTQV